MKSEDIKHVLQRNARIIYSNNSNVYEEINKIKPFLNILHQGYDLFASAILTSATKNQEEAIIISRKCLDVAFQHNDVELIVEVSMFMGILNRSIGRREEALKSYLTALRYDDNPRSYNNIADIYLLYGDYEEARAYLIKALDILDKKEALTDFDKLLLNTISTNLSEAEIRAGELDLGIESAYKCIDISEETGDIYIKASAYYLLGLGYGFKKEFSVALDFLKISQQLYIDCDRYSQSKIYDYIEQNIRLEADLLNQMGKYQTSVEKVLSLRRFRKEDFQLIILNYEALNDDEMTTKYFKSFMAFLREDEAKETQNKIDYLKSQVHVHETELKANNYELIYNHTKSIAAIGKDIIASEKLEDVLFALSSQIDKIMDFDSLLLAVVDEKKIHYNWVVEDNKVVEPFVVDIDNENSYSAWVARNNKPLRINNALSSDELIQYKKDYKPNIYGRAMDALLICPIAYNNKVYGILNIQSMTSYSYTEYDLEVINMLTSFIAVAMKNWQDTRTLKLLNDRLELLSKTDALTGISNRHVLSEIVEDIFSETSTNDQITVVMIDVDYFKEFNDTYGHIEGDQCLIDLVNAMRPYLNVDDKRLFRYGGDEFSAIVPNLESQAVGEILEALRKSIEDLKINNSRSNVSKYVTCSFGYTTVKKGSEYQRAFYLADEALYISKAKGKNCISYKDGKII